MTLKALPPSDSADLDAVFVEQAETAFAADSVTVATYPDVIDEQEHDVFLALRGHMDQMSDARHAAAAALDQAQRNATAAELGYSIFGGQLAQKYGLAAEDQITPRGRILRAPRS
jgi:hypothetical protein